MSNEKSNTSRRARNWCAVVYPESAPENWMDLLDGLGLKWSCSPLHDKDVDDDGVFKKAHYHIIICYSGNKSFDQVKEDLSSLNCPIPQICRDVRSSVRYFIHLDHPHKYQYSQRDILAFGGFDLDDVFKLSSTEKHDLFKTILGFIIANDITEYFDLVNYCMSDDCEPSWFSCVTDNSMFFERYLKSNRHRPRLDQEDCSLQKDPSPDQEDW